MRRGDFREILPQTIKDPETGKPFANNLIPPNRIDPNATLLLNQFYPLPNRSGVPNFVATPSSATDWREELIRVDHHFTEKISLMGRYAHDMWAQHQAIIKPAPQAFPTIGGFLGKPGQNLTLKLSNILSPGSLNEFTFGFSMNRITTVPSAAANRFAAGLTIPEVFPANTHNVIPTINLTQGFASIGVGGQLNNVNPVFTYKDDYWHQIKNHSLKLGIEIIRFEKFTVTAPDLQGNFTFNGGATGNAVADFLLGRALSYNEVEQREKEYLFAKDFESSTTCGGPR